MDDRGNIRQFENVEQAQAKPGYSSYEIRDAILNPKESV